ncbi:MAG: RNA 2',3'-cyclic phosphodiesterase [Bacteroidia bacterium]
MDQEPRQRRLFLGIPLPEKVLFPLNDFVRPHQNLKNIRWVPADNLHITVYFFDNVPEERVENLISLISVGLRQTRSFGLDFDRYCFAPQAKDARMIWARYRKSDAFRDLVTCIHTLYRQIAPQQIRKSPVPHITLARLRDFSDHRLLNLRFNQPPQLPVNELILWESHLRPEGAWYEVVRRFGLKD